MIIESLLNSDYVVDEGSHNNGGNIPKNDGNMNDNNNEVENNEHSKRSHNYDGNIPNNDGNMNNNNNDKNATVVITHVNSFQLPKDDNIARKRKFTSTTKPYQNKIISNEASKRDMQSLKKKTYYQFHKKVKRNQIYSSPIRFNYVSQEIFCDACGTLVRWTNIVNHC